MIRSALRTLAEAALFLLAFAALFWPRGAFAAPAMMPVSSVDGPFYVVVAVGLACLIWAADAARRAGR